MTVRQDVSDGFMVQDRTRPRIHLMIGEGFCPYGHGRLEIASVHGEQAGVCRPCGCSWRLVRNPDGTTTVWGSACIPDDHRCGLPAGAR